MEANRRVRAKRHIRAKYVVAQVKFSSTADLFSGINDKSILITSQVLQLQVIIAAVSVVLPPSVIIIINAKGVGTYSAVMMPSYAIWQQRPSDVLLIRHYYYHDDDVNLLRCFSIKVFNRDYMTNEDDEWQNVFNRSPSSRPQCTTLSWLFTPAQGLLQH